MGDTEKSELETLAQAILDEAEVELENIMSVAEKLEDLISLLEHCPDKDEEKEDLSDWGSDIGSALDDVESSEITLSKTDQLKAEIRDRLAK